MKIIVGLGNPGEKYARTRHNAGFLALDWLAAKWNLDLETWSKKNNALILQSHSNYILVKPQTFMNNSGQAVAEIINFYKIDAAKDLLVIHDDVDLSLGDLRPTPSSSAAGHNGVKDIIEKLGSQNFHRLRIGVESRENKNIPPTENFVLQNFTDEEIKKLQADVFPRLQIQVENFLKI